MPAPGAKNSPMRRIGPICDLETKRTLCIPYLHRKPAIVSGEDSPLPRVTFRRFSRNHN